MTQFKSAFPASILLLTLSVPTVGQTFTENPGVGVAPVTTAPMQSPAQTPVDRSVIVVKPELTDEQMGDLYMIRKDFREAAELYKRLADENPKSAVYLNKLGIAMQQQRALNEAMKYYERSSKLDPTYADALNNIGTLWFERKKYGKAIRAYQRAIKIRDDMAVLYSNLGYAYFEDKKYEQAMAAFRQTLVVDPQFFEERGSKTGSVLQDRSVTDRGRFYFLLAKSYAESGNVERCLIYLRKAKDEGYKELAAAKTDPAFALALKNPAIQEVFAPKPPPEDARP